VLASWAAVVLGNSSVAAMIETRIMRASSERLAVGFARVST
jgi:hypothetical protein